MITSSRWRTFGRWHLAFKWLLALEERQHAARCSAELLHLFTEVASTLPKLVGTDLYLEVVVRRTGGGVEEASRVLQHAEESYSSWPVSRALTFRDVVHYLAVSELNDVHPDVPWVHAHTRSIVQRAIPNDL